MNELPRISAMGMDLVSCEERDFVDWVLDRTVDPTVPTRIGYLNAATFNLCFDSPDYAALMRSMDCLYADGQAVVWAARLRGQRLPGRINAADLIDQVLAGCADRGASVGLIGSRAGVADRFANPFRSRIPNLNFALIHEGHFPEEQADEVLAELNRRAPRLVLLGMGSPRQERLAIRWAGASPPRVWWCAGALFEYASGLRRRAPVWMRRGGLEWTVRLIQEPRRLAWRYLAGNPRFVARVLAGRRVK